jgi:hypothetical protein
LALFTVFGEPVNLHENHNNAPPGGSFSGVLYRQPPLNVDWLLVPRALARRPEDTHLLFERAAIPSWQAEERLPAAENELERAQDEGSQTEILAAIAAALAERAAYFWMLAAVTAKYIQRGAQSAVGEMFQMLYPVVEEIEDIFGREPKPIEKGSSQNRAQQTAHLLYLCERVEALGLPAAPRPQIEAILNLSV